MAAWATVLLAAATGGCGVKPAATAGAAGSSTTVLRSTPTTPGSTSASTTSSTAPHVSSTASPSATTGPGVLAGKVVAIDPGHDGGNFAAPRTINAPVWNGREDEACDTTGTETAGGFTEAQFNWNVALDLAALLRAQGASVVLTRTSNDGVGPCITQRAAIANQAHAAAAVSIHADGGPPGGRGYAILVPVADGINDAIVAPSLVLGEDIRDSFGAATGTTISSYDGVDGIQTRDDLAGVNLSTVPKVFIECANMRNAADARLVVAGAWQQQAAHGIDAGLVRFLTR